LGYHLQGTRKSREECAAHPDRNAQFEHIQRQIQNFEQHGQPVISVDAKKKELIGDFHHAGREWRPQGCPPMVRMHDFPDPVLGKAIPYGVYDVLGNCGWVSVGTDHDTPAFAGATVRHWWRQMGTPQYPHAAALLLLADGGGSNSYRSRGWKVELQKLADDTRLVISVCHFPPGTSKWNKIEHRMFSYISLNWRGRPLVSHEVMVNLIASTTTQSGLHIQAALDEERYPIGIKVTDAQMAALRLQAHDFHGEWNYTLLPRATSR
jgi:Rhodopirellula transposase DDE domain